MKTFKDFMKEQNLVDTGNTTNNLVRMRKMLDCLEPKHISDNYSLIMDLRDKIDDMLSGSKD